MCNYDTLLNETLVLKAGIGPFSVLFFGGHKKYKT